MLKIKKIALTGGLAAGKTTVCKLFAELGAYVVSADEVAHQLLSPSSTVGQQVISLLGSDIIKGQEFDRERIASKVFSRPDLLRALEKIIHPAVFDEIERRYQQVCQEKKSLLFIAEIPLLYETDADKRFDAVVSVWAEPALCQQRYVKKTNHTADEFDKRMMRQMKPEQKAQCADFTIENNSDFEQLKKKVENVYSQLTA